MATAGQVLENPVTQQRLMFAKTAHETGGKLIEFEHFFPAHTGKSALTHLHPVFVERFEIIRGTACYQLGGQDHQAQVGDIIIMPAGVSHIHPWSISDEELHYRQITTPPTPDLKSLSEVETFVETLFKLADDGLVNREGLPRNPLRLAVLLRSIQPNAYVGGMSIGAQRIVFGGLSLLGRLLGYTTRLA